jgi:hypothetical protein
MDPCGPECSYNITADDFAKACDERADLAWCVADFLLRHGHGGFKYQERDRKEAELALKAMLESILGVPFKDIMDEAKRAEDEMDEERAEDWTPGYEQP